MIRRKTRRRSSTRAPYRKQKSAWMQDHFGWIYKRFGWFFRLSKPRQIALLASIVVLVLAVIAIITTIVFASTLSSKDSIMNKNKTGVTLLDRNDQVFYEFYNAHSDTYVTLDQISDNAKNALVAAEDKDFYKHSGFSIPGLVSSVFKNIVSFGGAGGGSTLTQQLVKNALLTQDRNVFRKYQEFVLAIEIERRYSKDEILEMYLNSTYFGEGAFGIEDAAKTYFNKSAKDLSAAEASMIIGVLPAPSAYSPVSGNAEYAKQRQEYVLGRMQDDGYLTVADADAAFAQELTYSATTDNTNDKAPHFALMVRDELISKYGEQEISHSGYKVKTTINLDWQAKAESIVAAQVDKLASSNVSNGSLVAIDPKTGEVLALVGSKDWNNEDYGKLNIATVTRQPGSSFKPIVYATGIEQRDITAATIFDDKRTDFGGYIPQNYSGTFYGNVTTRFALANSLNIPAVLAMQKIGVQEVMDQAKKLGITTLTDTAENYGLPLALGSGQANLMELTNAYAAFANKGKLNTVQTILSIRDKSDKLIYASEVKSASAISEQTAYIMSSILSDNSARAATFGSSLTLSGGRPAAVKTGTTENYRDAWTVGYTPSLAVGVWIGNNDNSAMSSVAGSSGSGPIWKQFMQQVLAGTDYEEFVQPSGIIALQVCTGEEAIAKNAGDNTFTEYFRATGIPSAECNKETVKQKEDSNNNSSSNLDNSSQNKPNSSDTQNDSSTRTDTQTDNQTDIQNNTSNGTSDNGTNSGTNVQTDTSTDTDSTTDTAETTTNP